MTGDLADRMRTAANTLEEASALYGYSWPSDASWSPRELRTEAEHVESEESGAVSGLAVKP